MLSCECQFSIFTTHNNCNDFNLILSYLYYVKQPLMIILITQGYKGTTFYNSSTHGAEKNLPSSNILAGKIYCRWRAGQPGCPSHIPHHGEKLQSSEGWAHHHGKPAVTWDVISSILNFWDIEKGKKWRTENQKEKPAVSWRLGAVFGGNPPPRNTSSDLGCHLIYTNPQIPSEIFATLMA